MYCTVLYILLEGPSVEDVGWDDRGGVRVALLTEVLASVVAEPKVACL